MKIDKNIRGKRIDYENPWRDGIRDEEHELYQAAAKEAENALAAIVNVQERRTSENGSLPYALTEDDINKLREEMRILEDALDVLDLVVKLHQWPIREEVIRGVIAGTRVEHEVSLE